MSSSLLSTDYLLLNCALVMHLLMRMLYLTAAGWEPDWIKTAVGIAERCWHNHHQPSPATESEAHATSQYAYSKVSFLSLYLIHRLTL